MSDPLNRYIGWADSSAPLRLCGFLCSRAEAIRDSCNSSLQPFYETKPCARRGEEKGGKGAGEKERNEQFYQTNPFSRFVSLVCIRGSTEIYETNPSLGPERTGWRTPNFAKRSHPHPALSHPMGEGERSGTRVTRPSNFLPNEANVRPA
jgi:hypothetical protein